MLKKIATDEEKAYGLDYSLVTKEKVPLVVESAKNIHMKRIY